MKSLFAKTFLLLFTLSTASAFSGVESSIEDLSKEFKLPKTGKGIHIKNGVTVTKQARCYVSLDVIDSMLVTAKNFEIKVGLKALGTDVEGWDYSGVNEFVKGNKKTYEVDVSSGNDCSKKHAISFSKDTVSLSMVQSCKQASKNRSESMSCKY